jgi:hypothetical protein
MHLKCILGADDLLDDDAADDPAFLEGNDSEPGGESKAFLVELNLRPARTGRVRVLQPEPLARPPQGVFVAEFQSFLRSSRRSPLSARLLALASE